MGEIKEKQICNMDEKTCFCVVILHYNQKEMTISYVDSLLKMEWYGIDHHIVIVDNNSPDCSGTIIYDHYQDNERVKVILSDENLGFSKGNNLGIRYCLTNFSPDLIAVSNNDIAIRDKSFFVKITNIYKTEGFAVFGPDIYSTLQKLHQNPMKDHFYNYDELNAEISKMKKRLKYINMIRKTQIYPIYRFIKDIMRFQSAFDNGFINEKKEDCVLHGSFFVLSKEYISKYTDGLYEGLFMYGEEDYLARRCKHANLKMLYSPEVSVTHFEGISTKNQSGNMINKRVFELEHMIDSLDIIVKMYKEDGTFLLE